MVAIIPIRYRWYWNWLYLIRLKFYVHWNRNVVVLKISSLAVPERVKMTTYCDENFSITFSIQGTKMRLNSFRIRTTWTSFIIFGFRYIILSRCSAIDILQSFHIFILSISLLVMSNIRNYFSTLMQHSPPEHDDVIKWKLFPRYWPFVRGIHRSRWIPRTKASDAGLWCFLWSAPGWTVE